MITLKDPEGNDREFDPSDIILIFYSKFLSPAKARSNVIYRGQIRSIRETPEEVVGMVDDTVKLISLTLPDGGAASAKGPAWFKVAAIDEVKSKGKGSVVKLSGQKGVIEVLETKAEVDQKIKDAA